MATQKEYTIDMTNFFKKDIEEHGLKWVLDKLKSLGVKDKLPVYVESIKDLLTDHYKPIIQFRSVKVGDILVICYYKNMRQFWADAVVVHKYADIMFYKFINDERAPKETQYMENGSYGWLRHVLPKVVKIKPYQFIDNKIPKLIKVEIVND